MRSTAGLLLLGGLLAAGAWNYQRNLAAEAAEHRPYSGYDAAQLEALLTAYRAELEQSTRAYQRATGAAIQVRAGGSIGEQIREFERVQRQGRRSRELGMRVVEREIEVERLQAERLRREREGTGAVRFLLRVVRL